jgi:hypothetical protein
MRKIPKTTARRTIRLTIDIPVELSIRLYGLAQNLGTGKGELAARLIDQGCRRYVQDRALRTQAAELEGVA